ncbi:MAG TPA: helix-turn-helix transcriptional regulator [Polyangiales bacterium]|jgi:AraC family transcriptional regulator|nr:helix-turn-helix transcriptional regulator [Polyangiales bacterium]
MRARSESLITVDREVNVAIATAQLVRFHVTEPAENVRREEENCWLDMCLTPRPHNARACFTEHWAPHRYERIGQVFLLPPKQTFRVRSDGGPSQTSIVCHLKPEALRRWFDGKLEWTDYRLEAGLDIGDANLRWLLLRLANELRSPGFASDALVELLVAQISIELGRYCTTIRERPTQGSLAPWRIRLIEERLTTAHEASKPPTLSELAQACNMSVRQLTRAFRASRGCSIGDYIAQCRIDHAKRMLASDQSIKAVAYTLGFASPSSFSYAFRSATGQTPREYKCTHAR